MKENFSNFVNNVKNKAKNKKAFTLAEILIVIAVIGVLVAISIPILSQSLEKSREKTDIANLRAAKTCGISKYYKEAYEAGEFYFIYDIETANYYEYTDEATLTEVLKKVPYGGQGLEKIGSDENYSEGAITYDPSIKVTEKYVRIYISYPQADYYGVKVKTEFLSKDELITEINS